MQSRTTIILVIHVSMLLFIGCDKGVTPIPSQPQDQPAANMPVKAPVQMHQRKIIEPDFLKYAWSGVKLQVKYKDSGESKVILVPLKKAFDIQGTDLTVEVMHFFPSFFMDSDKITSISNETRNPAIKLRVQSGDKELMNHWIFAKMPEIHGFSHPKWELQLLEGVPSGTK